MKRMITAALTIALLLAVLYVNVSAARYEAVAQELALMGMFRGTSSGFELDRAPTRAEAAIMLVRLYGAEEEAKAAYDAGEIHHPFTDVSAFASPYVAWLYQRGLVKGMTDTTYGAQRNCSLHNYVVFLLRALGYQDGLDFQYADAISFAKDKGIETGGLSDSTFLRDDLAALTYRALAAELKDGSTWLLKHLIQSGAIQSEAVIHLEDNIEGLHNAYARGDTITWMGQWALDIQNQKSVHYTCYNEGEIHDAPPVWCPSRIPDNWTVSEISSTDGIRDVKWVFHISGETPGRINFHACYPGRMSVAHVFNTEEAVQNQRQVIIQGYQADFFTTVSSLNGNRYTVLAWENDRGELCYFYALNVEEKALLAVAESMAWGDSQEKSYEPGWIPEGFTEQERIVVGHSGSIRWEQHGAGLIWLYSALPLTSPDGVPQKVFVNDTEAVFCSPSVTDESSVEVNGESVDKGRTINIGSASITASARPSLNGSNVLCWRDTRTGIYFQLRGGLDKDTMLRIAENMVCHDAEF